MTVSHKTITMMKYWYRLLRYAVITNMYTKHTQMLNSCAYAEYKTLSNARVLMPLEILTV